MHPFLFRQFRQFETKVHELNYLFWECTLRCNLSCRHCGSDCFSSSQSPDMPVEDFLKALDTIPKTHSRHLTVVLTGGEPLLRPDIDKIGKEIRRRGYNWSMVSNGYHYTEEMHQRLMPSGMSALTISLDGIGDSHNWMRGNPKSYERALKAIEIAAKEKYLDFDVVSCINHRSINQLEEIYTTLSSLGVKRWRIFTIIPIGRAVEDPDLHLSNEEMIYLMDFIKAKRSKIKPSGKDISTTTAARANTASDRANATSDKAYAASDKANATAARANTASDRANAASEKANAASDRANAASDRANAASDRANATSDKAYAASDKAYAASDKANATAARANTASDRAMEVTFSCEGFLGKYEEKVRPVRYFCHAGINIASVLIDGRICACPNIDRDLFSQGNIYQDNLFDVWESKFQIFRNRDWAKKGICADCRQWKNCLGGGMHNWHSDIKNGSREISELKNPLSCHYRRTKK